MKDNGNINEAISLLNQSKEASDYNYRQQLFRRALFVLEQYRAKEFVRRAELEGMKKRSFEILDTAREAGTEFREIRMLFQEMFEIALDKIVLPEM